MVTRKNIADIPVNDPEMKLFRDAVRILKERSEISPLDPSGWQAHGALHTTFCASSIYANQVHYNWYVWPWHRLYLWSMEQKLQKAVGEPQLALHYWDWTKSNFIPEHYWGDESNPLFNPNREVSPTDEIPKDLLEHVEGPPPAIKTGSWRSQLPRYVRLVRSNVLAEKETDYVLAERSIGTSIAPTSMRESAWPASRAAFS